MGAPDASGVACIVASTHQSKQNSRSTGSSGHNSFLPDPWFWSPAGPSVPPDSSRFLSRSISHGGSSLPAFSFSAMNPCNCPLTEGVVVRSGRTRMGWQNCPKNCGNFTTMLRRLGYDRPRGRFSPRRGHPLNVGCNKRERNLPAFRALLSNSLKFRRLIVTLKYAQTRQPTITTRNHPIPMAETSRCPPAYADFVLVALGAVRRAPSSGLAVPLGLSSSLRWTAA